MRAVGLALLLLILAAPAATAELSITEYMLQTSNTTTNATFLSFSPDGDGSEDDVTIAINSSAAANWSVLVRDSANATVKSFTATNAASIVRTWNGNGTGSYNNGSVVPSGNYTLRVSLGTGNETFIDASRTLVVLGSASNATPNATLALTVHSPQNATYTNSSVLLNATSSGNLTYALDGGNETALSAPLYLENLSVGAHALVVRANSSAGSASALVVFSIAEPLGLAAAALQPFGANASNASAAFFPNGTERQNLSISLNATREANWTLQIRDKRNRTAKSFTATNALGVSRVWDGLGTASYNNGTVVSAGTYALRVSLEAGNETLEHALSIAVEGNDTDPPLVALHSPQNTTYATSAVDLNASADEPASFSYALDGAANSSFTPNISLSVSAGSHRLVVWALDSAGNAGSADVSFSITIPAPPPAPASPSSSGSGGSAGLAVTGNAAAARAAPCIEQWECGEWSACTGTQERACTDRSACGTQESKPLEERPCVEPHAAWECAPGELRCVGALLSECSPDGSSLILVEECAEGCAAGACIQPRLPQPRVPVTGLALNAVNAGAGLLALGALLLVFFVERRARRRAPSTGAASAEKL